MNARNAVRGAVAIGVVALGLLYFVGRRPATAARAAAVGSPEGSTSPQDTGMRISAAWLRRLGEAADGYRTGAPVYIVATTRPFNIVGGFATRDSALTALARTEKVGSVFGPYVTPQDFGRPAMLVPLRHVRPTIWVSDTLPDIGWRAQDIDSLVVTVYHHSGRTWHTVSPGLEVDAMFFTLAAIDKFALPYYSRLNGPAFADSLRRALGAYIVRMPER